MANTKGKIIIGGAIAVVGGLIAWKITRNVKQNKIMKSILAQINDSTNVKDTVGGGDVHKYSLGLDPKFWDKKSGSPLPTIGNPKYARETATKIHSLIGDWKAWADDEEGILSAIRKVKSQGKLSQVAFAYENPPLNYGNLADDLKSSLEPYGTDTKDWMPELNNIINAMPY
jgi:hypothetical protein